MLLAKNRRRDTLIAVAAAALLLKIFLAARTYGTNDVFTFYGFSEWSRYLGVALYRSDPDFNHPPSMIHVLRFLVWLSRATPVPFAFWMRLPGILADSGSLYIVWKILRRRMEETSVYASVLLLAAAPASILIAGFHGNTDTVLVFFLLLSVYLTEKGAAIPGGAAFGLAMSIKIMPIVVIPALFFYLAPRRRFAFFAAASLLILVFWSPFLFQDPRAIWHSVFGYRSSYGIWGLAFLASQFSWLAPELVFLNDAFQNSGAWLALGLIAVLAWWMNKPGLRGVRPGLFSQIGVTLFFFLSITNGFGVQYLAWLLPWVTELGVVPTAVLCATSGCFLFAVYNYWSQGLPWYVADSVRMQAYNGRFDYVQLLCWLSVVAVCGIAWRRIADGIAGRAATSPTRSALAVRWAGASLTIVSILAMVPPQYRGPSPHTGKDDAAVRSLISKSYQDLSLLLYQAGRFDDSMSAAKDALPFSPPHSKPAKARRINDD